MFFFLDIKDNNNLNTFLYNLNQIDRVIFS